MDNLMSVEPIIGEAKKYLAEHPAAPVSEATHRQYRQAFRRLTAGATVEEAIRRLCDTRKGSTYYTRKYALRHELSLRISQAVRRAEEAGGDKAKAMGWVKPLRAWLRLGMALDALGPSCPIARDQRVPKKGKRRDLAAFPKDWAERLLRRMAGSVNYLPALVTAVSGCRPAELRQGVALSLSDGWLRVDIQGAKVGPGRGQEHRSFQYALPSPYPPVNDLAAIVGQAGGALTVSIKNPSSFSSALTYYGRAAFPRSAKRITPYSLRHHFASHLKLNCQDPDDVSRALGHRADRTRSSYGQAQQGRAGGLAPSDIDATHAVRHVRTDPRGRPGQGFGQDGCPGPGATADGGHGGVIPSSCG